MFALPSKSIIKSFIRRHHIFIDHYDLSSTGISLKEFQQRRHSLVNLIRSYMKKEQNYATKDFAICLPASSRQYMGPDVVYFPFKQQSDFYYLTGCMQPDALLLIQGDEKTYSTDLFLSRCSKSSMEDYERWFGPTVVDKDKICQMFGIDHAYPIDQLMTIKLPISSVLFYNSQTLYDKTVNKKSLTSFIKRFSSSIVCTQLTSFLHSLRSIKSSTEQRLIRQACQFTSTALIQTMKNCSKTTDNERLVKARFQYECEILGDVSLAFYPVVAANGRSNIIHYQENNQSIDENTLIMLDGGCLYKQYASDMTRLWPINGRFSSTQRQLYEILLTVQKDLIQYAKSADRPISRDKLNVLSDRYMMKYLREEHILSSKIDDHSARLVIDILCPTGVSHHLGLDVHDCELCAANEPLRPGSVITIEPGLYIHRHCKDIPAAYRGFAARIEDDVLITENGCEILSDECPKEVDDLYELLDDRNQSSE